MKEFLVTQGFEMPIKKPNKGGRVIDVAALKQFWEDCGEVDDYGALGNLRGCYVFSMKAGKGEKPWYVGKAARTTFQQECFGTHKRADHYNPILGKRNGTPYIRFVVLKKRSGGVIHGTTYDVIGELEKVLIRYAWERNPGITNRRNKPVDSWTIDGVKPRTPGNPSAEVKAFRTLMGFE